MCEVLRVSRSGFYAWLRRPESPRKMADRFLKEEIHRIHDASRLSYGSPRIHGALKAQGRDVGRKRVARLMREEGLRSIANRRFRVVTTDSRHDHPIEENLLNRCFEVSELNKVWASDITYIKTREGWLYLAVVMDLCSRRIVGWSMSPRLKTELVSQALEQALGRRTPTKGLLHHSDRGCQYTSAEYRKQLADNGIICSMSRRGNCWDNAVVESFFHSLKTELVHHKKYRTREEDRASLFDYIEVFYNRKRLHSALGHKAPLEFELELGVA